MTENKNGVSSVFTLDNLKSLLKEKEEQQHDYLKQSKIAAGSSILSDAIKEFYQIHGMLSPIKGLWERSIPQTVYKCPLSESTTTLVSWNELPRKIQALYERPVDGDIVEVNCNHLLSEEVWKEEGRSEQQRSLTHGMRRKPLQGNMTNKLTEYTRGVTGRAQPFLPGGVDAGEGTIPIDQDPYLTPEAIERSMRVLEQGSKASWEDGTLLTAPPGAGFKVGLSLQDSNNALDEEANHRQTLTDENQVPSMVGDDFDEAVLGASSTLAGGPALENITRAIQWDRNFLEDDSLFGSSVASESDGDSQSSESNATDDDEGVESDGEGTTAEDTDTSPIDTKPPASSDADGDEHEIDRLLTEITHAESRAKFSIVQKKKGADNRADEDMFDNPLRLAEEQARLQTVTTKKSWASNKLLPIQDFATYVPNPALKFPFTLDAFQQQAVARLERSESVFVAAHTSAGKTVIAEYAVALAQQRGTRCIYTSPIKALSNQKFRDFSLKFGTENVGLVTGDLQVNVDDSTCLIMTTEILRSMLYRGADLIRDIEFVVFDEVHYVNDSERGVVWEETIILLPAYVNLIFLSATTPNTFEFSDWIGRTKRKPVYVIRTDHRPVPLSHFLWANLKLHKVKEGNSGFLDKGYQAASSSLDRSSQGDKDGKRKTGPTSGRGPQNMEWQTQGGKSQWMSLIRFLFKEELTPTVVFSFSKKKCEEIANMLRSLDLNTAKERSAVQGFAAQTVSRLSPVDASLPQVMTVCEMVCRGIGVHHGGLLPILKEMVEILFSRNLIKVLFATETFAMGVNMPARSVVFNSIRKHDGKQFRVLEPGEYTQMAGRAGRRGLDKVGTVIMCCFGEKPPPIGMLRTMLTGTSTMLRSQFRLTYNMILNLLRVEEMSVESMIKRSFSEFATQRALTANDYPKLLARGRKTLTKLEEQFEAEAGQRLGADDLKGYFLISEQLMKMNVDVLRFIESSSSSPDVVLQPGRVLLITAARKLGVVRAPAVVLASEMEGGPSIIKDSSRKLEFLVCMVLLPMSYIGKDSEVKPEDVKIGIVSEVGYAKQRYYTIQKIELDQILTVTAIQEKIDPSQLYKVEAARQGGAVSSFSASKQLSNRRIDDIFAGKVASNRKKGDDDVLFGRKKTSEVTSPEKAIDDVVATLINLEQQELTSGLAMLDLSDFLKRGSDVVDFRQRASVISGLVTEMRQFQSHSHPSIEKHFSLLGRIHTLQGHIESLDHMLSNESLMLFPDFLQRKSVLKTLGYLDEHEAVTVKGRVACEVNTCEELIVTELVFEGVLNDLEPTEIVAALSSLVYQEKSSDDELDMEVPESLLDCCEKMKTIAMNLGQLQKQQGLDVDPIEYAGISLKFGLVGVVYEWAIGVPFATITQLTTTQEGSIVRCITRLDELCREVRNCARVVGNPTLYQKMEVASAAIKRDIVFAASLYVS